MFKFTRTSPQDSLNEHFSERQKKFWRKKTPVSETYSYKVHDPFEVIGEDTLGFEKLYLVGDNWKECPEKPVAIIIGCNDWKYGFIADYLKEYRCAFGNRKLVGWNMVKVLLKLRIKPEVAIIWGYNEDKILKKFIKHKNISLWRIEDGFIRSCNLGAAHSTPYSLVIDKTGLYYNSYKNSDIENLLNEYDFNSSPDLLEKADQLLKIIIDQKISKYNPPITTTKKSIKLKNKVLVIGQVDNDASLRYGNPDNWSMEEMVKLAKYENPTAEILYRPHPEVYQGYQRTKFRKQNISNFAQIISSNESIIDLIESVDQVYTLTSLTGLEALLRGKKVTVLGKPFYAGWGVTDDRCKFERRSRQLSVTQLFAIAYLVYPKYLADLENSYIGAFSAILRIIAERHYTLSKQENLNFDIHLNNKIIIGHLLNNKIENFKIPEISQILSKEESYKNLAMPLLLISLSKNNSDRSFFLKLFKESIHIEYFNKILILLDIYYPGEYLTKYWSQILNEKNSHDDSLDIIELSYKKYIKSEFNKIETQKNSETGLEENSDMKPTQLYNDSLFIEKFESLISAKKFTDAKDTLNHILLLSPQDNKALIKKIITVCNYTFDYNSTYELCQILNIMDIEYSNRIGTLEEFRTLSFINKEPQNIIDSVSKIAYLKPDKILYTDFLIERKFSLDFANDLKYSLSKTFNLDKDISPRKIAGLISLGEYEKAEKLAFALISLKEGKLLDNDIIVLTQALSYNDKIDQAIQILEKYISETCLSSLNITELMRLYVLSSNYSKSLELMNYAVNKGIDIGEMHRRKCYFGNGLINQALYTFKDLEISNNISIYFKAKYKKNKNELVNSKSIGLINIFGPGDEIRFASIYKKLIASFANHEIYIGCSPRLKKLFQESFENINFIGVERPRNGDIINLNNYSNVPGSDIYTIIDNSAISMINKVDNFCLVTDLLSDFLLTKNDFSGCAYLQPNKLLTTKLLERFNNLSLPKHQILVGLSWRSSITTSARNEHYLSVQEIEPLFTIPNVQFINLQYDDCLDELKWIESKYPNKIINFEDIDQYNDFDSVAALISCMDLVIAPATTVAELSGALGKSTWLFSNSSEIDWRKIDNEGTDIWHNSIKIVDVQEKGNKELLVEKIYNDLVAFSETHQKNCKRQIS